MSVAPDQNSPSETPKPLSFWRNFLSKTSKLEMFWFGNFLVIQVLQWVILVKMRGPFGLDGFSAFLLMMMCSALLADSFSALKNAHRLTLLLSTMGMVFFWNFVV
jgi:hypothetical protein